MIGIFIYADTGYFSIQVLQQALSIFNIELVSYASQDDIAKQAQRYPESIQAYVCNAGSHWFAIRRFNRHYFDLNSFFYVPRLINEILLIHYINWIKENGYSVFIVKGDLPPCLADHTLSANPIDASEYHLLIKDLPELIIDDKLIGSSRNLHGSGKTAVKVSKELYDAFEKNPDDPLIRRKVLKQISRYNCDETVEDISDLAHDSNHSLLLISRPKHNSAEKMAKTFGHSQDHFSRMLLIRQSTQTIINNSFTDDTKELHSPIRMREEYIIEHTPEELDLDELDKFLKQNQRVFRQTIMMSRSRCGIHMPFDDCDGKEQTSASQKFHDDHDNTSLQHMMETLLHDQLEPDTCIGFLKNERELEMLNRMLLKKTIDASLSSDNSTEKRSEESAESILMTAMNTPPTPSINVELTHTNNSELASTIHSEPTATTTNLEPKSAINPEPTSTNVQLTSAMNSEPAPTTDIESRSTMNLRLTPTTSVESASTMNPEPATITSLESTSAINLESISKINVEPTPIANSETVKINNPSSSTTSCSLTSTNTCSSTSPTNDPDFTRSLTIEGKLFRTIM